MTIAPRLTHVSKTVMDQIGQAGQMTRAQLTEPILSEWAKRLTTKQKLEGTPHIIGLLVETADETGSTFHVERSQCDCTQCQCHQPLSAEAMQDIIEWIDCTN